MNPDLVRNYLTSLQDRLCATLEEVDGQAKFITDEWKRAEGGGGRTRVIAGGTTSEHTLAMYLACTSRTNTASRIWWVLV